MQTITTVGYGDMPGLNATERIFQSLIMIIGVALFSFANGAVASLVQNYDTSEAEFKTKLNVLMKIYKDFGMPYDLFMKCKSYLEYKVD